MPHPDAAIIVTAARVVDGQDMQLSVEFSVRGDASFPAQVKRMRGRDPRGLAVLLVKNPPPGLLALELAATKKCLTVPLGGRNLKPLSLHVPTGGSTRNIWEKRAAN